MLNVNQTSITRVENLNAGDFCLLHDHGFAPMFVCQFEDQKWALVFADGKNHPEFYSLNSLPMSATVIKNVEIRHDPKAVQKLEYIDRRLGCIVFQDKSLLIAAPPPRPGYLLLKFRDLDFPQSVEAFGCERWQAVVRVGDADEVLFERKPS